MQSRDEYIKLSQRGKAQLAAVGWHHTDLKSVEVVHSGPDKVHLALTIDRVREDGTIYNTFDTLWIVTCDDGTWGIRFRSSFLR